MEALARLRLSIPSRASFAIALAACHTASPRVLDNRVTPGSEARLVTACTKALPRTPVANVIGTELDASAPALPLPWIPSLRWAIEYGFALVFAQAGDEEAVLVTLGDGNRERVIAAASAGTPCAPLSLIHHCSIADETDVWVFAELAAISICVDPGTPVVRAWRVRRDGTITVVAPNSVTCGSSRCF